MSLPSQSVADARRILDQIARRLLAEQLDADTAGATAGADHDSSDGRADQSPTLSRRRGLPATRGADDESGAKAA